MTGSQKTSEFIDRSNKTRRSRIYYCSLQGVGHYSVPGISEPLEQSLGRNTPVFFFLPLLPCLDTEYHAGGRLVPDTPPAQVRKV